jgi:arabinofuranosyltransferase
MNLLAGNGPVYNMGERVDSFTSPLWFLILSILGSMGLNLYLASIVMGLTFSILLVLTLFKINESKNGKYDYKLPLAILTLISSEAFVSFSTSGLETSLSYLLYSLVVYFYLTKQYNLTIFFIGLCLLTRLDYVVVTFPILLSTIFLQYGSQFLKNLYKILFLLAPLLVWEIFSVLYYGFIFPNTFYAKVGGRSFKENAYSGILYTVDFFASHYFIVIMLILMILSASRNIREFILRKDLVGNFGFTLLLCIILQFSYVIFYSGGDFMSGRFYVIVILIISILILLGWFDWIFHPISRNYFSLICTFILIAGIAFSSALIGSRGAASNNPIAPGVENERNYYKSYLGQNLNPIYSYAFHPWAVAARGLNLNSAKGILGVNGQWSYWVNLDKNLVDPVGITDAFISRTPIENSARTGHFTHKIPTEYLRIKVNHEKVQSWKDPEAEELYLNIKTVTEGKIFSFARLKSMFWVWKNYGL